jgi:murein peptide amidase A
VKLLISWILFVSLVPISFADEIEKTVPALCASMNKAFKKRRWGANPCGKIPWIVGGHSVRGRPLIYAEFGPSDAKNVTLIFAMVHGDEITPLYLGFEVARHVEKKIQDWPQSKVIVAPLVSPDGFLDYPKTRTNANGVDCNRNLGTKDWDAEALKAWKKKFASNPRRFPGTRADSEPETIFQKEMISKFKPTKIISIHAPLNFIDYDGPDHLAIERFSREYIKTCVELQRTVRAVRGGFFPGSLGNYAGQDLGIPTITLELPSANADKGPLYWKMFRDGIATAIEFDVGAKASDAPK